MSSKALRALSIGLCLLVILNINWIICKTQVEVSTFGDNTMGSFSLIQTFPNMGTTPSFLSMSWTGTHQLAYSEIWSVPTYTPPRWSLSFF